MTTAFRGQPSDATLSVTKAARMLGVHPNTVRTWSDQGRLRYYRINPRGDRRFRVGDLERFLAASEGSPIGRPGTPGRRFTADGAPPPMLSGTLQSESGQPAYPGPTGDHDLSPDPGRNAGRPGARLPQVLDPLPRPLFTFDDGDRRGSDTEEMTMGMRAARDYAQMATWAAQLQSIQQLGGRLNRLTDQADIGNAIATELRQLIDYHNVRVYRAAGAELLPIAFQGEVGEYDSETTDQLRIQVGQGITGWVAEHRLPQYLPDAARDPRAQTIVGTEEDLDESMLLAPMVFDDELLGVLVLAKLGLDQFTEDDLRLLVIYASFAAQAFANGDSTALLRSQSASLERQLRSQRELIQISESILTTLDPRAILDQIAERLSSLVSYDNISIEVYDRAANLLTPLTARGVNSDEYLQPWEPGETGVAVWVLRNNEPILIRDEITDPRVHHFESTDAVEGSLIVVPLRGRDGVAGVLTLERLGGVDRFDEEEFELVKLFAGLVSIALNNAEIHLDVETRARTDDLTGLLNHGTFKAWLDHRARADEPFSLIMLDLDDFRVVNNELGHQAGDQLLRVIGAALTSAGRDTDHVFRYGGDEFAFILPGTGAEGARAVAERARRAIRGVTGPESPWALIGSAVTASIGIATYPTDGESAESVLLAADRASYVAKRAGHDRIASAEEARALGSETELQQPTPVDTPSIEVDVA